VNLTGESKNFKMLELRVPLNIFLGKKKALTKTIPTLRPPPNNSTVESQ
jgi:hypothetical protein